MAHFDRTQIQTAPAAVPIDNDDKGLGELFEGDVKLATLVDVLRYRALQQPDRRAFAFLEDGESENSHLIYAELDRRARGIAALLQEMKAAGERVLLLYPPGLEYVAAFFGCLYAGAIAVPVYPPRPNRTPERLREIAVDAGATVALTATAILNRLQSSLPDEPVLRALRWLDTEASADLAHAWRYPNLQSDDLAFLQYTSGSTSQPKGVMVSHGNLVNNARMICKAFELTEESSYVSWLPLYHDMGLIGCVVVPVYMGIPSILMSPLAFLQKPFFWLQAITRYRASISGGPNFAYDLCARKVTPDQRAKLDLSSWRIASNGAEPVRADTLSRFTEAFRECGFRPEAFYPCYGLAEATLFVSGGLRAERPILQTVDAESFERDQVWVNPVETAAKRTMVGCGRAWLDARIVIANPESLTECSPDQVGEVWVSGPQITKGYWNRSEETRRTFDAFLANTGEGPFLRTGDLGFVKEGELFLAGRLKDLIIIEGRNHHPQDIEQTVERSHPAIQPNGCTAFSIEVDSQERLVIVAEIDRLHARGGAPGSGEILKSVRRAVAENHDLQTHALHLVKVGSILRTSSGKLRRAACRKAFLAGEMAAWGNE